MRKLKFEGVPLRNEKGETVYDQFGNEWITFLSEAIQKLLASGELIKKNGNIVVPKGLTS